MALWCNPNPGYYNPMPAPYGWLPCVSENQTGSRIDYSATKYFRIVKAFFDAGNIALIMPYDIIMGFNVSSNTVVISSNTSGSYTPSASIYNLPTFSTTNLGIRVTIVCGTASDIISSNNNGYITILSTLGFTWYIIFVIDGVIIYPAAVTEREKIVYVNIKTGYTSSQVASAIFAAFRPFWNGTTGGYMSFSLPLAPDKFTGYNVIAIIKT
jgi:hypothetical protein